MNNLIHIIVQSNDGKLLDLLRDIKKFIFKANSITPDYVEEVPLLFVDGVIVR